MVTITGKGPYISSFNKNCPLETWIPNRFSIDRGASSHRTTSHWTSSRHSRTSPGRHRSHATSTRTTSTTSTTTTWHTTLGILRVFFVLFFGGEGGWWVNRPHGNYLAKWILEKVCQLTCESGWRETYRNYMFLLCTFRCTDLEEPCPYESGI